jgi:hypothetical protein
VAGASTVGSAKSLAVVTYRTVLGTYSTVVTLGGKYSTTVGGGKYTVVVDTGRQPKSCPTAAGITAVQNADVIMRKVELRMQLRVILFMAHPFASNSPVR